MSHTEPTTTELQEVLDTSLDNESLQAHIDASKYEVEDIISADSSIADDRLTKIHTYLAAFYASSQEQKLSSQSGESRSLSYATEESADYFELAKRLDPTGTLDSKSMPDAGFETHDVKGIND